MQVFNISIDHRIRFFVFFVLFFGSATVFVPIVISAKINKFRSEEVSGREDTGFEKAYQTSRGCLNELGEAFITYRNAHSRIRTYLPT